MDELKIVFDELKMTKEKAMIWYEYSNDLKDDEWKEKIRNCIWCCRETPTLAHILDNEGYYAEIIEIAELESIWNIS